MKETLFISEMTRGDIPFLQALWQNQEVMRFADEFPYFRGWSRRDDPDTAWNRYREQQAKLGSGYIQLIIRYQDRSRIGESFFAPLQEGLELGQWRVPVGSVTLLGDIKLLPGYWGRGLGTMAMREITRLVFRRSSCDAMVVPPHKKNRAAVRVYEKAGFRRVRRRSPWTGHMLMKLSREDFIQEYRTLLPHD